jgi:hypothetical protein
MAANDYSVCTDTPAWRHGIPAWTGVMGYQLSGNLYAPSDESGTDSDYAAATKRRRIHSGVRRVHAKKAVRGRSAIGKGSRSDNGSSSDEVLVAVDSADGSHGSSSDEEVLVAVDSADGPHGSSSDEEVLVAVDLVDGSHGASSDEEVLVAVELGDGKHGSSSDEEVLVAVDFADEDQSISGLPSCWMWVFYCYRCCFVSCVVCFLDRY